MITDKYEEESKKYINLLFNSLQKIDYKSISEIIYVFIETLNSDGTIYVFGNGGSASTASHMQNDFNRGLSEFSSKKFKFCCLSDNVSTITAIANDYTYDEIYLRQLEGRLIKNDIICAFSGSGNSPNIIKAVEYAKKQGNRIIGITGFDGGKLMHLADLNFHVEINNMQITEDIHLIFNHLIMTVLTKYFKSGNNTC